MNTTIADIELVETCGACPEQYDAYLHGEQVGYLRLRHGHFRVDVPDCGGTTIYEAEPRGDGIFESDEREHYLTEAKEAILAWLKRKPTLNSQPPVALDEPAKSSKFPFPLAVQGKVVGRGVLHGRGFYFVEKDDGSLGKVFDDGKDENGH